ncbi:MAG: hypothetical protein ACKPKO_32575 [Candidatus Fonsibacter sp.]
MQSVLNAEDLTHESYEELNKLKKQKVRQQPKRMHDVRGITINGS